MNERSVFPGFAALDGAAADVGTLLGAQRRAQGLTQREVAARMGTSQPAVARLEAGSTNARLSTLFRYADAVGCTLRIGLDESA